MINMGCKVLLLTAGGSTISESVNSEELGKVRVSVRDEDEIEMATYSDSELTGSSRFSSASASASTFSLDRMFLIRRSMILERRTYTTLSLPLSEQLEDFGLLIRGSIVFDWRTLEVFLPAFPFFRANCFASA